MGPEDSNPREAVLNDRRVASDTRRIEMADKRKRGDRSPKHEDWPQPETRGPRGSQVPREELRRQLPEQPPLGPDDLRKRQQEFPSEGEIEYERSVIRIPFYLKGAVRGEEGRDVDVMSFDAFMRIIREPPIRNGIGFRQFEFYIDAWELTNTYSKGLNANVTFTLSDTVQPKSICIARQRESDYPALIVYSAIYDVYLDSEKIIDNQPGTAFATPVWEVPPRGVTVAFEKPFESDLFAFSAGCCEGMRSIDREEFLRGLREARGIRGWDTDDEDEL
jgi:hypothetical protein